MEMMLFLRVNNSFASKNSQGNCMLFLNVIKRCLDEFFNNFSH